MWKVYVRADASTTIGSGHVMRCLTLAEALERRGAKVKFLCRNGPGNLMSYINDKGYEVIKLPERIAGWQDDAYWSSRAMAAEGKADWLIVDHYGLDWRWETEASDWTSRIMVIDDLADRRHECQVLLDQNWYDHPQSRYRGRVSAECLLLLGLDYFLVRPEFQRARQIRPGGRSGIHRVFLFMGGADATNETEKVLLAWEELKLTLVLDVVVGSSNPQREKIEKICRRLPNVIFHCQTERMAELMMAADLAVGAGGVAMWERAYLGLPSLLIQVAANQREPMQRLIKSGLAVDLGWYESVAWEQIALALNQCLTSPQQLKEMGEKLFFLFQENGESGSEKVTRILKEWGGGY